MFATRLPLVLAFASGGIASAALFGYAKGDSTSESAVAVRRTAPDVESTALRASPGEPAQAQALPRAANGNEPARAEDEQSSAESADESGSSLADVLSRLEAAYREELAAVATDEPATVEEGAVAPAVTSVPAPVPAGAPPPEPTPGPEPPKVVALREDPAPRALHVGDVHRNSIVGDVHQNTHVGNVSQTEVVVVQQLALLQYLELLAPPSRARPGSHRHPASGVATRRSHGFSLPLTNPENPWGFDFPPTVLAK